MLFTDTCLKQIRIEFFKKSVDECRIMLTLKITCYIDLRKTVITTHKKRRQRNTMTKAELIEKMAEDAGISKVAAAAALNSFMDCVVETLKKKDGKVTLVGFGTFSKLRRKARKGRNPQTGESIKIKACNVAKFRPGKRLKDGI